MFRSRSPVLNFVLNFVLGLALFWFFKSIGWFSVTDTMPLWVVALIVTFASIITGWLVAIVMLLISPLLVVVACLTLGLGFLVLGPAAQYFSLLLVSNVTHLFSMSAIWWQALIIGLSFGLLKFNTPSKDSE
jgi:hypothetical protein